MLGNSVYGRFITVIGLKSYQDLFLTGRVEEFVINGNRYFVTYTV